MTGISIGLRHPRPCSGPKTFRSCRNSVEDDNVILIDVDSESFDDVVVIDVPGSLPKKREDSSVLGKGDEGSFRNVINIDDDETHDSSHSNSVNNVSSSAGTSSNSETYRVSEDFVDSRDAGVEDGQFVQDNATPVRLSKCKRTYSGKVSTRNRYGLDTDSDCDSSDNDYPDCELVEDSSGKVQELWEKASSRRRKEIPNGSSGMGVHDCQQHKEATSHFSTRKSFNDNNNNDSSPPRKQEDSDFGCTHSFYDALHDQLYEKSDARGASTSRAEFCPSNYAEQADCPDCEPGSFGRPIEERWKDPVSSNYFFQEESFKNFDHTVEDEETSEMQPSPPDFESRIHQDFSSGKSSHIEAEATMCKSKNSFENGVNQGRSVPGDRRKKFHETEHLESRQSQVTGCAKEMENLMSGKVSFMKSTLTNKQTSRSSTASSDASGKSVFSGSFFGPREDRESCHKENRPLYSETPLFRSFHLNEAKFRKDNSVSNIQQQENKDNQLHNQNGETLPPEVETCIISEREKLKETDEYKRAIEEEWASRKQALLVQAEEAKHHRRLRKRRKAERMRLLDMERRQQQRLEEIRNTQKKDEENMNMKETIRAEVIKELQKLEIACHNMASLLHSLGISVGSWPNPSPQEVQTAYRKALLAFHPDRATKSDMHQQVEAEEKFKLINHLREKFPHS